jgi:hypothetical protein
MKMTIQVVAKRDRHVFEVLPRRWVVERTFAWISKHRRTVRDYEHLPASHEAMILWAMTALMARRLTQPTEESDAHLGTRSSRLRWMPESRCAMCRRPPRTPIHAPRCGTTGLAAAWTGMPHTSSPRT